MNKKITLILLCLLWASIQSFAQTEYDIHMTMQPDTATIYQGEKDYKFPDNWDSKSDYDNFRPKWYVEPHLGMGFILGDIEGSEAKLAYGESYNVDFGFKWRYQPCKMFSLVMNTDFVYNSYSILNGLENNIFNFPPDFNVTNYTVHGEDYQTWALSVALGARFHLSKPKSSYNYFYSHGAKLGNYIEAAVYGNWNYSRAYNIYYYGATEKEMELRYKDPAIFAPFEAGAQLTLAWGWLSIWGRYRITQCFNSDYSDTKLSPFSAGIAFTFGSSKL